MSSNCVLRQVEKEQTVCVCVCVCVCVLSEDSREAGRGLVVQSPLRAKGGSLKLHTTQM